MISTDFFVPALLVVITFTAYLRGVDVFSAFLRGAKQGMQTVLHLLPTMIALLTAVYMLRASGAIDLLANLLSPLFTYLGIPAECTALVLLKPISGGGGLALGSEIMQTYGADSYAGLVAAVMLGASETSIYTIGIYTGTLGIKRTRYLIPAALLADCTAFVSAAYFVRLFFF